MRKSIMFMIMLVFSNWIVSAQTFNQQTVENYVQKYSSIAMLCSEQFHIPASILLAQALVYTKGGTNHLVKFPNNHLAVTCSKTDTANRYYQDDNLKNICFKKYDKVEDSYIDYLKRISSNELYTPLFKLSRDDYKGWAMGLQKIGHSTSPTYGSLLIQIIETYHLNQFDPLQKPELVETKREPTTEPITVEVPIIVEIDPALLEQKVVEVRKKEEEISEIQPSQPMVSKVYTITDTIGLTKVYYPYSNRPVYEKDGLKFVIAVKGDSFLSISKSVQLPETHIRLYNDLYDYKYQPVEGEVVYIQKKKTKSKVPFHTIVMGESLRYISQIYGIQLEKILERNDEEYIGVGYILCISCKK